jgi:hypothetical protein
MIGPMKEAAQLKKSGEPLPGEMSIGESIDRIIFNGYTTRKVKTVLLTSLVVAPASFLFVYFLHMDILLPLGIANGNFGSASLTILTSFILLSIPISLFCKWYYVDNGDPDSFDEETGAYEGETHSKVKAILFVLIFAPLFAAFFLPVSGDGIIKLIQLWHDVVIGGSYVIQLDTPEIILLSLVVIIPVLFLLAARFRWKIVFVLLFAITIFGVTVCIRSITGPAFPKVVYEKINKSSYSVRVKTGKTFTVNADVSLRSGPSTTNDTIKEIHQGDTVTSTGETSGFWTKVTHNGDTGWVTSGFLDKREN